MDNQVCPFCGAGKAYENERIYRMNSCGIIELNIHPEAAFLEKYLEIEIYYCSICKKESVSVHGENGYIENKSVSIYPKAVFRNLPEYVPRPIREDYIEASLILQDSPKASATLSRRCLQGMIRDVWGIRKNRLIDEIKELQEKIPTTQWMAIDMVRKTGNIGAHMEKDVSTIIEITHENAAALLNLIELLIKKWYIDKREEEELYHKIIMISSNHQK